MNLSFVNFLIPLASQSNRLRTKSLTYSVLGATWFVHRKSPLREWRGSKKYEKFSCWEMISPSREDPVLSIMWTLLCPAVRLPGVGQYHNLPPWIFSTVRRRDVMQVQVTAVHCHPLCLQGWYQQVAAAKYQYCSQYGNCREEWI